MDMVFSEVPDAEKYDLYRRIQPGVYVLCFGNYDRWAVHRVKTTVYDMHSARNTNMKGWYSHFDVDTKYHAPGWTEQVEIYQQAEEWEQGEWICHTFHVKAVMDTQEQADEMGRRISELCAVLREEMKAPLLKLDMGMASIIADLT